VEAKGGAEGAGGGGGGAWRGRRGGGISAAAASLTGGFTGWGRGGKRRKRVLAGVHCSVFTNHGTQTGA